MAFKRIGSIPVTGVATFQANEIFLKKEARTLGKMDFLAKNEKTGRLSGLELETVLSSNLYNLITPKLILQFQALKDHLGIKSFKKP